MARTKQTSRKNVGKAPRKNLGLVKAAAGKTGVVVARRWRPGTVALREIAKYQSRGKAATDLLLRKRPFGRLVREVATDVRATGADPIRFEPGALSAIQHASEGYLVEMFAEAQDYALHARREGLDVDDVKLAKWKMNTSPQQRNLTDCPVKFKRPRKSTPVRRRRRAAPAAPKSPKKVVSGAGPAPSAAEAEPVAEEAAAADDDDASEAGVASE